MSDFPYQAIFEAFQRDDAATVRAELDRHPELKEKINEPMHHFDSPVVIHVKSRAMLDVLLDAGADINGRSNWWAGSFGLLDFAPLEVAKYAVERGAVVTIHAAARLGMIDRLKELIAADPTLVHAPGGDGKKPLHFASTVEIAAYLVEHGAEIDARDVDHESTAAQYLVREQPMVTRYLIGRGGKTDILMAAALDDRYLAEQELAADPDAIRMRVQSEYFPMVGDGKTGGTIYQWVLGWYVSSVQVARKFGYTELSDWLMERCPPEEKLLNACWLHDEALVDSLLTANPDLAAALPSAGRKQLAHAARNNDLAAARLMLRAGLPIDTHSQHHGGPLHWAAWHGNVELVRLLLEHKPQLEDKDNQYGGTPMIWAMHGSENGWWRDKGDYPATVRALLGAGASVPANISGTPEVRELLA